MKLSCSIEENQQNIFFLVH